MDPAIQLPNHGGQADVQAESGKAVLAYQFENLPAPVGGRKFRLLVTPALPPAVLTRWVRVAGNADGTFVVEATGDGGPIFVLRPGDPELQLEVINGAVTSETRLTTITIQTSPYFDGRTSVVMFDSQPE